MKKIQLLILFVTSVLSAQNLEFEKQKVTQFLDQWHAAAASANFETYFGALAEESIFIGTDATENWNKKQFQAFAKPYFDKGKAWNFKAIERNIYFNENGKLVWFDELLSTQMKICRGSGVLVLEKGEWKIKHYVLSMTIPNDTIDEVVKIKAPIEDVLLEKMKQ
jgi:hypothetical protein